MTDHGHDGHGPDAPPPASGAVAWAVLDELWGMSVADRGPLVLPPFLEYGRVSTEDRQDPVTSARWQADKAAALIAPLGGVIVDHRFDHGHSRSVPWSRRPQASQVLRELDDPARGWGALVVGEGTRCWFAQQFSLVEPLFHHHGVELWIPEVGGRYDRANASHRMLMSILGGMSESERQHVQARVRGAQAGQVAAEGRFQGGRPPYGYRIADSGPHPHPAKAADGDRLRALALDQDAATVVQRVFAEYIAGAGYQAIAARLNADRIDCPSRRDPARNPHRSGDGWQAGTVRTILMNPRYTGYEVWGRTARTESLLDPLDPSAGNVVKFIRAAQDRVVRSERPAHPAIVDVATFTDAALVMNDKTAKGPRNDRAGRPATHEYPLRGLVRCAHCGRKMDATTGNGIQRYRCVRRTLVAGTPEADNHPRTAYVREDKILPPLNAWLARLLDPDRRERTLAELAASQPADPAPALAADAARQRAEHAAARLRRHQQAIEAGVDPAALADAINQAHRDKVAADHEHARLAAQAPEAPAARDWAALLDRIEAAHGTITNAFATAPPALLAGLYRALGVEIAYDPVARTADVTATPADDPRTRTMPPAGGPKAWGIRSVRGGT